MGRTDNYTSYSLKIQNSGGTNNFVVRGDGNVGIGVNSPTQKLFVSGNTRSENNIDGDVSIISVNTNNGGTLARGVLAASAIADISGRILSGLFTTSGYNTDLSGFNFGDGGTGYLKNALTISVAGNNPRGDINIGTRNPNKFLRFFSGTDDFDSGSLRGSLNSSGYWGFGQNMTGQTAIVHIKGGGSSSLTNSLKIDNSSNSPLLYVRDDGNVGIGVENPTEKLHISGNTKITGGLNIGTIGSGSPLINLGLDSNGNVVTGTTGTGGGSGTFTGGTGSCITDLYVTNIHGCSPITVHDILSGNSGGAYINLNTDLTFTYTPLQLGIGDPIIGSYISFGSQNILLNTPNNTILTNNGNNSYYSLYDYGISLSSVPGGSMTASTIILTTTNSTNFGSPLTGGSQQGEIVFGIPNLDTGLPLGVMGTGLGSQTVPYGTPGVDYNPVFISTPRSRAYDNTSYSSIKNVLFGGGSDNSVYSGVTNSALIGGSGNTINSYTKNSVVLGGEGITSNQSNTVYVPDLVIKKSASIPTSSGSTFGEVGSITWDENYFYVKTLSGWGRTVLNYNF